MKKFFYLLAASLLFSFLIISCSSDVAETKEVSFTIPNAFAQVIEARLSSRSAAPADLNDYSFKIQLTAAGSVYEQKASLNADNSNVNVTFRNVVVGSSATLKVWLLYKSDETIATGSSDPFIVKEGENAVKITLKFEEGKGFRQNGGESGNGNGSNSDILIYFYNNGTYTYKKDSAVTIEDATDKFAYDSDGNVWALKGNENTGFRVVTDKNGARNTDYSIVLEEQLSGGYGITIDQENDTLYTYICKPAASGQSIDFANSTIANLYQYSTFLENPASNQEPKSYTISYSDDLKTEWFVSGTSARYKHAAITVHNNVLYDLIMNDSKRFYLIKSDLGETDVTNSAILGKNLTEGYMPQYINDARNSEKYLNVNDMIYVDGNLYVLFSDNVIDIVDASSPCLAYHGCIIKINPESGDSDILGWSGNTDVTSIDATSEDEQFVLYTLNSGIYYPGYIDSEHTRYTYETGSYAEEHKVTNGDYFTDCPWTFRVPQYSSNPAAGDYNFCSPRKFLAVKPKKLVISDSGIAFYTADDGFWAYKNINRIVTVNIDLGNFLIESIENADVIFTQKETEHIILNGSGMRTQLDTDAAPAGYFYRGEATGWVYGGSEYSRWLGIPNID